jgi:hypothetical protein
MQEELKTIMKHFGMETERNWLRDECKEFLDSGQDEEIADIYVLAKNIHDHSPVIQRIAQDKVKRTLKRIKEGYYAGRANSIR